MYLCRGMCTLVQVPTETSSVRSSRTGVITRCELPDVGAGNGIELGSYVTADNALDC